MGILKAKDVVGYIPSGVLRTPKNVINYICVENQKPSKKLFHPLTITPSNSFRCMIMTRMRIATSAKLHACLARPRLLTCKWRQHKQQ